MAKHLQRDLDNLKRELLAVGTLVEESIASALRALIDRRRELAEKVVEGDEAIDALEVKVEDECLKILALHQPMAFDLRFVVAVLKVNNDLERMGDLAVSIARRAIDEIDRGGRGPLLDVAPLGDRVREMVRQSLDALIQQNTVRARAVCALDKEIDDAHRATYQALKDRILDSPDVVERAFSALTVSRALERIADLATNIAEDVVFMVEGEVIRHGGRSSGR